MKSPIPFRSRFPFVLAVASLLLVAPLAAPPAVGQDEVDDGRGEDTGPPEDPASFESANAIFNFMRTQKAALEMAVTEAEEGEAKETAQQELDAHVTEMIRIGSVGLGVADRSTSIDKIQKLRYLMCYEAYKSGRHAEAGLLGAVVGRELVTDDPTTAQGAAYIALIALQKMYSAANPKSRSFEVEQLVQVASILHDNWPETPQAESARILAAGVLYSDGQFEEAANWYARVPETSPKYVEAQLVGGRAAFSAYNRALLRTGKNALTPEDRQARLDAARNQLVTGITKTEAGLAAGAATPANVVYGKVALAQIHVSEGKYAEALELLVGKSHPVHPATVVAEGTKRPTSGPQSVSFASSVEQLLLRTYVGLGQLDEAQTVVKRLESYGGDGGGSVAVYVNLGRQLRDELLRLKAAGETAKLGELATAFDGLLGKLLERSEELKANELRWVGSTYNDIGAALPKGGDVYAKKAAAVFETMLNRARRQRDFLTEQDQQAIQLLQAQTLQTAGDTKAALTAVGEVLRKKKTALNAQVAAAEILEAQGSREPDSLLLAINGTTHQGIAIWGWGGIARRLQPLIEKDDPPASFVRQFHEARYHSANLRREYALSLPTDAEMKRELDQARLEVFLFTRTAGELDDETWAKFDELYQSILAELGRDPAPLARPGLLDDTEPTT